MSIHPGFVTIAATLCLVAGCWLVTPAVGLIATGVWGVWAARRLSA